MPEVCGSCLFIGSVGFDSFETWSHSIAWTGLKLIAISLLDGRITGVNHYTQLNCVLYNSQFYLMYILHLKKKTKPDMMVHAFKFSTRDTETVNLCQCKSRLVYIANTRPTKATV